jgi:sugar phosphate permease
MAVNAQTARALTREHHGYRFVVLGVVWTSYLIVYLSRLSVGPLAPFLKDAFNLSNAEVGSLMSATAITYAPSMIVAGLLVDRFGVKRILVGGTLVAGICVALLFVAPSYPALLALLALSGFGCGFIYPAGIKALMLWFPPRQWATAIGLNQSAINVSGIAGAALLPTVAVELGWQYGFLFVGMVALVISAVCSLLYRDPAGLSVPPAAGASERDEGDGVIADAAEAGDAVPGPSGWSQTLSLLRRRDAWLLCTTGLFLGVVEFSVLAHLVLFLNKSLLYTAVAAGGLRVICEAAGAVGKPGSGAVSDRLFRGRRKPALLGLCVGAAVVCGVRRLRRPSWLGRLPMPGPVRGGRHRLGRAVRHHGRGARRQEAGGPCRRSLLGRGQPRYRRGPAGVRLPRRCHRLVPSVVDPDGRLRERGCRDRVAGA